MELNFSQLMEALDNLTTGGSAPTLEQLIALVNQGDVSSTNNSPTSTSLLFSGPIDGAFGNPINSSDSPNQASIIAARISNNSDGKVSVLGRTELAKFVTNGSFVSALNAAVGQENFGAAMYGENVGGVRNPGIWDYMSERYASRLSGVVNTLTAFPTENTWFHYEMPALINNQEVTTINGIKRSDILAFHNEIFLARPAEAASITSDLISVHSNLMYRDVKVVVDNANNIIWVDGDKFGGLTPPLPVGGGRLAKLSSVMPFDFPFINQLNYKLNNSGLDLAKYMNQVSELTPAMKVLGGSIAAVSFLDMAYKANELYPTDYNGAYDLIRDYFSGSLGSAAFGFLTYQGLTSILSPLALAGPVGISSAVVIAIGGSMVAAYYGEEAGKFVGQSINKDYSEWYDDATNATIRRDPLVLDLDGDGLELTGLDGATRFDHNADSVRTGTGWSGPDDGILVYDRNGNGTIDSGRELFGIDTLKSNGNLATDGFDALRDLDSNLDGQFTAADAFFSNLRVWRDLNQDGISQSTELSTLAALGISRIGLAGSSAGPQAGQTINDNFVALSTTFTINGQQRTIGAIDLVSDTFNSSFVFETIDEQGNPVAVSPAAQLLPGMRGSGLVRNMQSAATLDPAFLAALQSASQSTSASLLSSQLDSLISKWALTSGLEVTSILERSETTYDLPSGWSQAEFVRMMKVLDAFGGRHFYDPSSQQQPEGFVIKNVQDVVTGSSSIEYLIKPIPDQMTFLQKAYDSIRRDVYESLAVQTFLKPYLAETSVVYDSNGKLVFDGSGIEAALSAKKAQDAPSAFSDLVELIKLRQVDLTLQNFDPSLLLQTWVTGLPAGSPILPILHQAGVRIGSSSYDNVVAGSESNILIGKAGDDILEGGAGRDVLIGGDGNDSLYGEAQYGGGDRSDGDVFDGGAGNDFLVGGGGGDVYLFGRGDGQDTISNRGQDPVVVAIDVQANDVIQFKSGVYEDDVSAIRLGNNLILKIIGTTDQITVTNFFLNARYGLQPNMVDTVRFADGASWSKEKIVDRVLTAPTNGSDALTGYESTDDWLIGFAGNDTLYGYGGNDHLNGGDGHDFMDAGDGNDTLIGGVGDDTMIAGAGIDHMEGGDGIDTMSGGTGADVLIGGAGNDFLYGDEQYGGGGVGDDDVLDGGAGNDYLVGGGGNDTYLFGKGDGQDTLVNRGQDPVAAIADAAAVDILQFKPGVLPSEVTLSRNNLNLIVKISSTTDQVTVTNFFQNVDLGDQPLMIDQIKFDNGTVWTIADIKAKVLVGTAANDNLTGYGTDDVLHGLAGHDVISGRGGNDTLHGNDGQDTIYGDDGNDWIDGGTGDDTLYGGNGNDQLFGSSGVDSLYGDAGNDIFVGGIGNDYFEGGTGADTYQFARGDGADTIYDHDATVNVLDYFQYAANIASDQLWFKRVGNHLEVSVIGTSDKATINYWYSHPTTSRIERFQSGDGKTLQDSQVQNLVQAMAAFSPPAAGQTTLPNNYATTLTPVLAANWA